MGNFINDIKWPFSIAMLNYQRVVLVGMHPSISNPWHGLSKTVSLSWIDLQLGPVPRPCCQCRSLGNYLSKIGTEEKRKLCTSPVFGGPNLIWQKKNHWWFPLIFNIPTEHGENFLGSPGSEKFHILTQTEALLLLVYTFLGSPLGARWWSLAK